MKYWIELVFYFMMNMRICDIVPKTTLHAIWWTLWTCESTHSQNRYFINFFKRLHKKEDSIFNVRSVLNVFVMLRRMGNIEFIKKLILSKFSKVTIVAENLARLFFQWLWADYPTSLKRTSIYLCLVFVYQVVDIFQWYT